MTRTPHYLRTALVLAVIGAALLWPVFCWGEESRSFRTANEAALQAWMTASRFPGATVTTCDTRYSSSMGDPLGSKVYIVIVKQPFDQVPAGAPIIFARHWNAPGDVQRLREGQKKQTAMHRVTHRTKTRLYTCGDANYDPDPLWTTEEDYLWTVAAIYRVSP